MHKHILAPLTLLLLPVVGHAQTAQDFVVNFTAFLGNIIIPFLIGIAFLFFVINAIRFFVLGSTNEQGREKAKALALYGILAFIVILVFWGIVNLIGSSIGFGGKSQSINDYCPEAGCL